jgi:hypothetical protein
MVKKMASPSHVNVQCDWPVSPFSDVMEDAKRQPKQQNSGSVLGALVERTSRARRHPPLNGRPQ